MRACITCHPVVDLPVIAGFVDERVIHLELAVSQLVEEQSCKCAAQHTKHKTCLERGRQHTEKQSTNISILHKVYPVPQLPVPGGAKDK